MPCHKILKKTLNKYTNKKKIGNATNVILDLYRVQKCKLCVLDKLPDILPNSANIEKIVQENS